MSLFTNPVVLTDGTSNRTFSFLHQDISSPNSVSGVWIEDAADQVSESQIVIKHDQRTLKQGFRRDLLQRTIKLHPAADTETDDLQLVTINVTVVADKRFTVAELQPEVNVILDAIQEANFLSGLRSGKI